MIAITVLSPTLDSKIDTRFGRANHLLLIHPDSMEWEELENPGKDQSEHQADGEDEQDQPKGPGRGLDVIEDDIGDLQDQPRGNGVGNAHAEYVSAFQFLKKRHPVLPRGQLVLKVTQFDCQIKEMHRGRRCD